MSAWLVLCAGVAIQASAAAAEPTADPRGGDLGQRLMPDPAYPSSAEKKYRDRVKAEGRAQREAQAAAARDAYLRLRAVARARSATAPVFPPVPLLHTLLFTGAGAIIGHQSHHAWEGAAVGAALGGLVDAFSYQSYRRTPP